jgi:4a-hydroxytetrahydrobiopterin dehydratase
MNAPHGWTRSDDALTRSFRFRDFAEAFAFLTQVAEHAERVNHHPEFTSVWNRVDLRLTTHSAERITQKDLALAEAINVLTEGRAQDG